MKLYRFSPIKTKKELLKAITHIHFSCHKLCIQAFGKYLSVAGNVGVFCHYDDEYEFLTNLRKKLTDASINWNQKYFRLYTPIVISAKGDIPKTTYTYLYIRKPDVTHLQVGDLDFYMKTEPFTTLKQSLFEGKHLKGASILNRPDLDLIELSVPDIDAVAFVGGKTMEENVKTQRQYLPPMKEIEFIVDGLKLKGNLFYPEKPKDKNPAILFTHGWTSEKQRSFQYAEALTKLGFIIMLFDMRGHGVSEGNINIHTPKEFLSDCIAAYDYLLSLENVDKENISLVGSSFGGYLSVILTSKRKVKNLVLRVPADYQNETFKKPKMGNVGENLKVFKWRLIPMQPHKTFALEALHNFSGQILIIESEKDDIVPHQIIQNYINAVQNKSKSTHIVMNGAPHSIREGPFRDKVTRILVDWFKNKV